MTNWKITNIDLVGNVRHILKRFGSKQVVLYKLKDKINSKHLKEIRFAID